jgi:hypothetical protein
MVQRKVRLRVHQPVRKLRTPRPRRGEFRGHGRFAPRGYLRGGRGRRRGGAARDGVAAGGCGGEEVRCPLSVIKSEI